MITCNGIDLSRDPWDGSKPPVLERGKAVIRRNPNSTALILEERSDFVVTQAGIAFRAIGFHVSVLPSIEPSPRADPYTAVFSSQDGSHVVTGQTLGC